MKRLSPGVVLVALLVVRTVVHAILASWTPLSNADWDAHVWVADHDGAPSMLSVLVGHPTLGKLVAYALSRSHSFHVIGSPFAGTMLLVLLFTFARRRLPAARWDDVLDLAVLSMLIWVGEPRCGLVFCYRPYIANMVWGGAVVLAVLAPYRCGWRVGGAWLLPFAIGAFAAGTTAPAMSVPAIVGVIVAIRRAREPAAWRWVGLVGLVAGLALASSLAPYVDVVRIYTRGLDGDLSALALPVREHGELIALVAALALIASLANAVRPGSVALVARTDDAGELVAAPRWLWVWLGSIVLALLGPQYGEATLLPGTMLLAVAALPFVRMMTRAPRFRWLVITIVAGIHAVTWAQGLALYHRIGLEYADRIAVLEAAPPSTIAVIRPYSDIRPGFWFFGESWQGAATREIIAREVFGLADIEMATPFRGLEHNPRLAMTLESTGATGEQLLEARRPNLWPRDLGVAHMVFGTFAKRLAASVPAATAHLAITNLDRPELAGRPLYVGWIDAHGIVMPKARRASPDQEDRFAITFEARLASRFPEVWVIGPTTTTRTTDTDGKISFAPMDAGTWAVVACDDTRCLAIDAFVLDL